jgi:type III restriction enzyme
MKLKFEADQEYQIKAVDAVIDLLQGQPKIDADMTFIPGSGCPAVANRLDCDEGKLLENLCEIQKKNGVAPDSSLQYIEETVGTIEGERKVRFPNFSVEMETGTGKTYVYIRTALELFRNYGLRKFIVVVPGIAVKEGVLKTLQITYNHFRELLGNIPYRFYVYDSSRIALVRQFAMSDGVELMIMTLDSFNKSANIIRQTIDRLQGETPIHLIQSTLPVIILDEPQNMESEKSIAALAALNPLFALRYSATHRNHYNLVYRLTPYDAFRQGLVKKIEVASVIKENDFNKVYIKLHSIDSKKNTITAKLGVHKLMKDGTAKEASIAVKPGDKLSDKTKRPEYDGYDIDEINPGLGCIYFSNGKEVKIGESLGADNEVIFEAQIKYAIEAHIRKQKALRCQGIKVLTLFFLDRVASYRNENGSFGIVRQMFDRLFNSLKSSYSGWESVNPEEVQAAYFAKKKQKSGEFIFEDSTTGKSKKDEEAYNLIMKEKERLLSFDEPVSFIFSHSALREGWDNPNIFQICTLNRTVSEIKKRQEVGRGVRLAVNQTGNRISDAGLNILTVVANESYEKYVEQLQNEIEEAYGKDGLPPAPPRAGSEKVRLRKEFTLSPEFKSLWEKISQKTRYSVKIDTEKLLKNVGETLAKIEIKPPRVIISKALVEVGEEDSLQIKQMSARKTTSELNARNTPDLITNILYLMEQSSLPVSVSRKTIIEIIKNSDKNKVMANPWEFASAAAKTIREKLADILIDGIKYEKLNDWYEMTQFEEEFEKWREYLIPASRSLYDYVVYDSQIEKEFVETLEKRDDVKMYVKLPGWFTVPTPVGYYNPDWAIIMEDRDVHGDSAGKELLYLVRETKSTHNMDLLHPDEKRKIICGEKHFREALEVDYKVVVSANELP